MSERKDLIINENLKLVDDGDRLILYAHPHVYEMDQRVANEVNVFVSAFLFRNKPDIPAPIIEEKEYRCFICVEWRKESEIEETIYGERLCKYCYASVSAQKWDEAVEFINEANYS